MYVLGMKLIKGLTAGIANKCDILSAKLSNLSFEYY